MKSYFLSLIAAFSILGFQAQAETAHSSAARGYSQNLKTIETEILPHWTAESFSDPRNHNPESYLYVIRVSHVRTKEHLNSEFYHETLSASLIGRRPDGTKFNGAFTNFGWAFILKVNPDAVIASLRQDSGQTSDSESRGLTQRLIEKYRDYYGLHTPEELLYASAERKVKSPSHGNYNEIFLAGKKGLEIIGIANFVGMQRFSEPSRTVEDPVPPPGTPDSPEKIEFLRQISENLGVPIVNVIPD